MERLPPIGSEEREISLPEVLKPYFEKVGLKWKVRFFQAETDTLRIDSNSVTKEHRIWVGEGQEKWQELLVHELCHGKLAETLDPNFSQVNFHPRYDIDDPQFRKKAQLVYLSQAHVDIWVDDLVEKIDPILTKRMISQAVSDFDRFLKRPNILYQFLKEKGEAYFFVTWGMNTAEIKRRNLGELLEENQRILERIFIVLGANYGTLSQVLSRFYEELPKLPSEKEKAIELLQSSTQSVSQILNFPIKPKLIEHTHQRYGKSWVWKFD